MTSVSIYDPSVSNFEIAVELAIPADAVFNADDDATFIVHERGGGDLELDARELNEILEGECHLHADRPVDHRRGGELGDDELLHIHVMVLRRLGDGRAPSCTEDALEMGWVMAPLCDECRSEEKLKSLRAFAEFASPAEG